MAREIMWYQRYCTTFGVSICLVFSLWFTGVEYYGDSCGRLEMAIETLNYSFGCLGLINVLVYPS